MIEALREWAAIVEAAVTLLDGMPAAGIRAAPTDEIADRLVKAVKDWAIIKEELNLVFASSSVTDEVKPRYSTISMSRCMTWKSSSTCMSSFPSMVLLTTPTTALKACSWIDTTQNKTRRSRQTDGFFLA
ncbi:MAG: hypothetical protein AAF340_05500 [Pseudomonadota bacterium]